MSTDNGESKSRMKIIYRGPSAYSTVTLLENSDLGIVFEKDNYTQNALSGLPKSKFLKCLIEKH